MPSTQLGAIAIVTDTMHYESRAIRDSLRASTERLNASKSHAAAAALRAVQQDWAAPKIAVDLDKVPHMRACLYRYIALHACN